MEYRILKQTYINHLGKEDEPYYQIQVKKKFLMWTFWRTIKHKDCGWGDCYDTPTNFKTHEDAQEFVDKFLCTGRVYQGTEVIIVEQNKCN